MRGALLAEIDLAVDQREQRVVGTHADVFAGVILRSTLTNDDVACNDGFTAEFFQAQTFRLRIAAVLGTAAGFFVCHVRYSDLNKSAATLKRRRCSSLSLPCTVVDACLDAGNACGDGI